MKCRKCGSELQERIKFCPKCGEENVTSAYNYSDNTRYCTHCGKQILKDAIVCPYCGCSAGGDTKGVVKKKEKPLHKRAIFWVIIIAALLCVESIREHVVIAMQKGEVNTAASTVEEQLIGEWNGSKLLDMGTKYSYGINAGTTVELTANSDNTGTLDIKDNHIKFTWKYVETDSEGKLSYKAKNKANESEEMKFIICSPNGSLSEYTGELLVNYDDKVIVFDKK